MMGGGKAKVMSDMDSIIATSTIFNIVQFHLRINSFAYLSCKLVMRFSVLITQFHGLSMMHFKTNLVLNFHNMSNRIHWEHSSVTVPFCGKHT